MIGGARGVGKSHVSYPLARHFGVGITEIDDFQVILERMTTPEQQPVLHFFRTDPDAFFDLDEEGRLAHAVAYARVMAEPLEYVVANHLESGPPIILEGDFLLPSLAAQATFDGIPAARQSRPRLTTVDVPSVQIGRRAAELLMATARDGTMPASEVVPVQLVIGESTPFPASPARGERREKVDSRPGGGR